ncbi:hypothetical protein FQZ97_857140 [compost metagenome]
MQVTIFTALKVHQIQRHFCNALPALRAIHQPLEHARAPLGRLIEQDRLAVIARGQRLAQQFTGL